MPNSLTRLVWEPQVASENPPLLILLHGLGSNERDLMELAPELDPSLRVVTLRAPHAYSVGGYAWFEIQWGPTGIRIDPAQVFESIDRLSGEVEALRAEFSPRRLILGGFSQGAIMTVGATLRRPGLVDGAMALSGRFIPELFERPAAEVTDLPVLVQHGLYDQVLDVAGSRVIRDAFAALGAKVTYFEYPMGHEVSWESIQDADRWLRDVLA